MKDFIESLQEAQAESLRFKASALQALILERFRSLTIVAAVGFAVVGVSLDRISSSNCGLFLISFGISAFVVVAALGRYLVLLRSDIGSISEKIEHGAHAATGNTAAQPFKADWWPETLYVLLVIAIGVLVFAVFQY